MEYKLFTTEHCHKCPSMKEFMASQDKVQGKVIDASTPEGMEEAQRFNVIGVPTVVFLNDDGEESHRCMNKEEVEEVLTSLCSQGISR